LVGSGYVAVEPWPLDEYTGLTALYDRAHAILEQIRRDEPGLPEDYEFGDA
jgi:hypothetical protein